MEAYSGEWNPADIATREYRPNVLPQLWFHGPEFLKSPNEKWSVFETVLVSIPPEAGIEKLRIKLTVNVLSMTKSNVFGIGKIIDCKRFSNLKKLLIVSALVLRFVRNMKCVLTGRERVGDEVTLLEVRNSELEWLKFEQHFIIQDSKFQKQKHSLNLYFDENDILRSQTRINQIKGVVLQESQPILLRSNSYFTELVVLKCHNEVKHSGLESTLNRIRCKYWLIRGRSTVKSIIRKCVTCRLIQAKCVQPPPTPLLPEHRLSWDFPFQEVRVDGTGPLYVRDNYSKSTELFKAYILVFICATTRCTYLELVTDFTTETLTL